MTDPNQVKRINLLVCNLLAVDKVEEKPLYKLLKDDLIRQILKCLREKEQEKYSYELMLAIEDCLPYYDPQKGDFLFYCKKALERRKKASEAEELSGGTNIPKKKAQIFGKLRRWLLHRGILSFPTEEQLDLMAECFGQPREKLRRLLIEMERICVISVRAIERDRDDDDGRYEMTDSERRSFDGYTDEACEEADSKREEDEGDDEREEDECDVEDDDITNGWAEVEYEAADDCRDGKPSLHGVELDVGNDARERLYRFFRLLDECVRECQERQHPILAALITAKLCTASVFDAAELSQYIFFDAEVYREFLRTGVPFTQRDIADRFGRNEASISRTWNNFIEENPHLPKLLK